MTPPYRLAFEIRGELPLLPNAMRFRHWTKEHANAKRWKYLVALKARPKPKRPLTSAKVTLTRLSSRRPDPDGLVGSFKVVLDALQRCGVLANDDHATIGMPDYRWEPEGRTNRGIRVEVEARPAKCRTCNKDVEVTP